MNEYLCFQTAFPDERSDIFPAHFPRQNDARKAKAAQKVRASRGMLTQLCARVQDDRRERFLDPESKSEILQDICVRMDVCFQKADEFQNGGDLAVRDQRVQGQMHMNARLAAEDPCFFQLIR